MVFQPSKIPNFQENKTNLKPSLRPFVQAELWCFFKTFDAICHWWLWNSILFTYIVILRTVFWHWIYLEVQSSTQYSSLLPLSLHIWIDTPLYLFFCFLQMKTNSHFSFKQKNSMWSYFVSACISFCSHPVSTDVFNSLLLLKRRDHIQTITGWSLFKEFYIFMSWK